MRIAVLMDQLKRLINQWPVAMIAFGILLTVVWIGVLIGIAIYLFVISSQS
jgi:hypothetical protein